MLIVINGNLTGHQGAVCSNTNTMKTNRSMRLQNRDSVHRNRFGLRMIMMVYVFQSIAAGFLQAVENLPICEVF